MKICILGNTKLNYSWFLLTHRQGLKKLGHEVIELDYKSNTIDSIYMKLLSIKADIVFTHLTFHHFHNSQIIMQVFKDVRDIIGTKFIHTCNDARDKDRYMGDISDVFHMAFVGTYSMVKNCESSWKIPVNYSPYSSLCYDKIAKPVKELMFNDPVFTGSPTSHTDRSNFIKELKKIMNIKIFQTQSSTDMRHKTPELSSSAKCILGLCTGYDIDGYIDVRPFQYLGTGACMIMRKFKNMDDIIPPDLYFPFDNYDDPYVVKKQFEIIERTDTRLMRELAFDYIQKNHSCEVRMAEVLEKIFE